MVRRSHKPAPVRTYHNAMMVFISTKRASSRDRHLRRMQKQRSKSTTKPSGAYRETTSSARILGAHRSNVGVLCASCTAIKKGGDARALRS